MTTTQQRETLYFQGREFPIFDSAVVLTHDDFEPAARRAGEDITNGVPTATTFVRTAEPLRRFRDDTLTGRLSHTEAAFAAISKFCGSTTIGFRWGLCLDDDNAPSYYTKMLGDMLPRGYLLVAEVDIILPSPTDCSGYDQARERYLQGVKDLQSFQKSSPGIQSEHIDDFIDYGIKQTIYGKPAYDPKAKPLMWFVDIEPIRN